MFVFGHAVLWILGTRAVLGVHRLEIPKTYPKTVYAVRRTIKPNSKIYLLGDDSFQFSTTESYQRQVLF